MRPFSPKHEKAARGAPKSAVLGERAPSPNLLANHAMALTEGYMPPTYVSTNAAPMKNQKEPHVICRQKHRAKQKPPAALKLLTKRPKTPLRQKHGGSR